MDDKICVLVVLWDFVHADDIVVTDTVGLFTVQKSFIYLYMVQW